MQEMEVRDLEHVTETPKLVFELRSKRLEYRDVAFGAPPLLKDSVFIEETLDISDLAMSGEIQGWGVKH